MGQRAVAPTAAKADDRANRCGNNEVITVPAPRYRPCYLRLVGTQVSAQAHD